MHTHTTTHVPTFLQQPEDAICEGYFQFLRSTRGGSLRSVVPFWIFLTRWTKQTTAEYSQSRLLKIRKLILRWTWR